jgi:hypothetical protein
MMTVNCEALKVGRQRSGERVVSSPAASRPDERRITLGNYIADIVISEREERCCYYVIQRAGSTEIIDVQRFDDPIDAEAAANAALIRFNQEDEFATLLPPKTPW